MDLLPRLLSSTARSFSAVRSVNEPISIARIPGRSNDRRVSIDVCRDFTAASSCCDSQGTRSSVDRDRRKSRRRGRAAKTSRSNQWLPSPPPLPRGNRNAARTCSGQRGIHMFEEESSLSLELQLSIAFDRSTFSPPPPPTKQTCTHTRSRGCNFAG